ncbi:hypothetical protein AVEN_272873-1 [Araneus ventricosus]|uniref:Uncharacterized protein n=1 Tax=Araneus ventricosus TaxID=182803 RepID=A0A4Y2J8H8_ARAVE|nr:hypothetical protein AVEN_193996-1 [Araneus ventricosus]GBM86346.1 hypothetical protein AVEN_272873-1 [Araneus ventricosus]
MTESVAIQKLSPECCRRSSLWITSCMPDIAGLLSEGYYVDAGYIRRSSPRVVMWMPDISGARLRGVIMWMTDISGVRSKRVVMWMPDISGVRSKRVKRDIIVYFNCSKRASGVSQSKRF